MLSNILYSIARYEKFILPKYCENLGLNLDQERKNLSRFYDFINLYGNFSLFRENLFGHITVSALVINPRLNATVLTLHKKLNKWLQLGGHCDGNPNLKEVIYKEVEEESGLKSFEPLYFNLKNLRNSFIPFDVDIHMIPASEQSIQHLHFDIRYLFTTSSDELVISNESSALDWISLKKISLYSNEQSLLQMFYKFQYLKEKNLVQ